jgi:hypothetical protein
MKKFEEGMSVLRNFATKSLEHQGHNINVRSISFLNKKIRSERERERERERRKKGRKKEKTVNIVRKFNLIHFLIWLKSNP